MKKYSRQSLAKAYLMLTQTKGKTHAVRALAAAVISQRQTKDLDFIIQAVSRELWHTKQELHATVTSARPLSQKIQTAIQELMQQKTGARSIVPTWQVDPALIGGFTVVTPALTLNASIARQLATLNTLF